ncbi:MAG: hydroxyquinol 1,2-dioxygenase [Streptosporangiales bacterium]|nr:hydroxyquinol 1,2-dioxygenase [Streptosporangiales bacterium]
MAPRVSADQARREQMVTERVVDSFEQAPPRLRELMQALVRHAHAFVRETRLTEAEWEAAIGFLHRAGEISTEERSEFILISDVLGISMQTVGVNNPPRDGATEATVLGPFFLDDAPEVPLGGDTAQSAPGEPAWVHGTVTDTAGQPIPGARLEIWQADESGLYDVQYTDGRTAGRACLFADEGGAYRFWAVTPGAYPIPTDGPIGGLLEASGRLPMRPAHLHFMVSAPGYRKLITHIFVEGDGYLTKDAVFGVKESLIKDFVRHKAGEPTPDGREVPDTWTEAGFQIVLVPEDGS